ncbi:electron transport complex subunit RsxC [Solemya velum gill symbiont]|uniref:Ion-translocating oxidoreductase complex subunit C n=1 Tax=Solemya velum gill symbiont TaxID=2340 RepID=A0A1T2CK04_SOVGS|nr:electron transport complex subunit RsxC [Solemya velum gill symbiont]OOY35138.1 electron transport complex subunit RsxC [Solemya velum gill symbiont]
MSSQDDLDKLLTKPHNFHGGLHLPEHKQESLQHPIADAGLPQQLVIPLRQHIGHAAKATVKAGDKVLKGERIAKAEGAISAPVHAPTSGTVKAIEVHAIPHPAALPDTCIVIEPDGNDQWTEKPAAIPDYLSASPDTLLQRIHNSGIVGMGGAAFPSHAKLLSGLKRNLHTLIINGAECEPYITCDDILMQERADDIVTGIEIILHLLGLERCLIGIEDNKPDAIAAMQQAIKVTSLKRTRVIEIPTIYPSGGEKQLIQLMTGEEVPSDGLPTDIGMVCHNVGTMAAVRDAVLDGRPLISRIVTISGEGIAEPRNLHTLIGTPISHLIQAAGGYTDKARQLVYGGPMMGISLPDDRIPLTKGGNCILALSENEAPDPGKARACIRCGKCADVCPVKLLPQQLYWYSHAKDFDKVQDYNLFDCIECGCCTHVCPSNIQLVHYFRFAKTEIWKQEEEKRKADHARRRHEARTARLERIAAERKSRLRKKKEDLEQKKPAAGKADAGDPKKAAIEAAMKRVADKKKAAQEKQQ